MQRALGWNYGVWSAQPEAVEVRNGDLLVTAVNGSDFWRTTAYGFVHDNGHGLLGSFSEGDAMEVSFRLDFCEQFDQAGILVRAGPAHWMKAGVEISDGEPHVGAVATNEMSDWSLAAAPNWRDTTVTVRVSWRGDALIVRARSNIDPWQLVRVSPWVHAGPVGAGPYVAAPSRPGLQLRISGWTIGTADPSLH
jgi:regulation of enolase protein 1 (concanavalin A-like superfamily)